MKTMKNLKLLAVCTLISLIAFSCGPRVQTMKPNNVDLSNYQTFAYLPNSNVNLPNKRYNDETVNTTIIDAINMNMKNVGYTLDRDNPDLLVLVSTKTNLERDTSTQPVYARYPYTAGVTTVSPFYSPYYYRGYNNFAGTAVVGYDTDTYTYQEGTLVINLVDRQTKQTVWKGVSSKNIYNETTNEAIIGLVDQIFSEFPLKK